MGSISLIGMPASGKSTVGVVLAKTACRNFIDTDLLIQEASGCSLQEIIDRSGMDVFLEAEKAAICSVFDEQAVIATGGSAVYIHAAMEHLSKLSDIIYLKWELPVLLERLGNIKTRGVAMAPGFSLEDLYRERTPLYERYADRIIECDGLSVEEIIEKILSVRGR
ncbi:MAG TPA: shikimate kinase [Clostridiales bacterium]|jgi:shikimate kinase|nr:shikimate kinase [Clostridiales bacterium]